MNCKTREYTTNSGETVTFDISVEECLKFGFKAGTRVSTPAGRATVIGVYARSLWFHVDGESGAYHWSLHTCPKDFAETGFRVLTEEKKMVDKRKIYLTKTGPVSITLSEDSGKRVKLPSNNSGENTIVSILGLGSHPDGEYENKQILWYLHKDDLAYHFDQYTRLEDYIGAKFIQLTTEELTEEIVGDVASLVNRFKQLSEQVPEVAFAQKKILIDLLKNLK